MTRPDVERLAEHIEEPCACGFRDDVRALLTYLRAVEGERDRLRDLCEERAAELLELREAAERPKCAYCTFGENELVSLDALKWHVEKECGEHPIAKLIAELDSLRIAPAPPDAAAVERLGDGVLQDLKHHVHGAGGCMYEPTYRQAVIEYIALLAARAAP